MPWFNVDDGFAVHTKTVRAGNAAIGLWVRAGSWCAQQLTDGFVPADIVAVLGSPAQAKRLVSAGLWNQVDGGYQFHEWETRQRSRETVLADRAYNVRKAALYRDAALLKAVRNRDGDRCRYCGTLVDWNNRRGSSGGAYDHVDPAGPNTLTNLVVACRSCKSRKSNRSLEDCGMPLLDPRSMGVSGGDAGQGDAYQNRTGDDLVPDQNSTGSEQDPLHSTPLPTKQKKTSSPSVTSAEPPRDDVEQLCQRLRERIIANDCKPPRITKGWRDAARLLLDNDGRDLTKALNLIDWATSHSFWRSGIQSMPTFREKYDQLRLQAQHEWAKQRGHPTQPQVNQTDANIAALLAGGSAPALQLIQGES